MERKVGKKTYMTRTWNPVNPCVPFTAVPIAPFVKTRICTWARERWEAGERKCWTYLYSLEPLCSIHSDSNRTLLSLVSPSPSSFRQWRKQKKLDMLWTQPAHSWRIKNILVRQRHPLKQVFRFLGEVSSDCVFCSSLKRDVNVWSMWHIPDFPQILVFRWRLGRLVPLLYVRPSAHI